MLLCFWTLSWAGWEPKASLIPLYNEAIENLNDGELADAQKVLERLLKQQPDCGLARVLHVQLLLESGKTEGISAEVEALVKEFPDESSAWRLLARYSFLQQDFVRSLSAAQEAVRLAPNELSSQQLLQQALIRKGLYTEAEAALDAAKGKIGEPEIACMRIDIFLDQKKVSEAQTLLARCEQSTEKEMVRFARANLLMSGEDADAAAEAVYAVGADNLAQSQRARAKIKTGDYQGCVSELTPLLAKNPKDLGARLQRASCYYYLQRHADAKSDLQFVFQADTWVDLRPGGTMTGIVTQGAEEELWNAARLGSYLLVTIELEDRELEAAAADLERMKSHFGEGPETAASTVQLLALQGQDPWPVLLPALQKWPNEDTLLQSASAVVVSAPPPPPEVITLLHQSSAWNDRYNLAASYFNRQQYRECLQELDGLSPPESDKKTLLNLTYDCAAGAEDLVKLDQLLTIYTPTGHAAVHHAWLLLQANRKEDAKKLLEAGCKDAKGELAETCQQLKQRSR